MALFSLDKVLNLEKWQDLQDSLADITQLAIITIDYKGKPISTHSKCTPFCKAIRADETLSKMCQKCDSRAGLEAVRYNRPYIYLCHYNIIDIAIPIANDDKYIGAIMAGQVKPDSISNSPDLEQIVYDPVNMKALQASEELMHLYNEIPTLSYDTILRTSNMLFKLCNYIIEEAYAKNVMADKYHLLAPLLKSPPPAIIPDSTRITDTFGLNPKNKILLPALEYIHKNLQLMVSLETAAELCHLSPGYFSRSFTKEFGMSYTLYNTELKVSKAKELLTNTDLSVTQIGDQLGFNDSGYFTKVFKKYEYLTPSMYRKYVPLESMQNKPETVDKT